LSSVTANPVLVVHTRGGITESFHRGVVCIVDSSGSVIYSTGDVQQVCYPRSALKFFQHIPLITSGAFDHFGFSLKELALMCGSHNGEEMHTETARGILAKIGMGEEHLGCGAQTPTHKKDYVSLIKEGKEPGAIHNNCSGKHSGFLAWCVFNNQPTNNYLESEHPLHREIKRITALFHEMNEEDLVTGLDGCSAPIFAMPVLNQAIAYKNLLNPAVFGDEKINRACSLIREAIATYPEMVAGTKRYCTDLMAVTRGKVLGKTGADGVYSIGIPSKGYGICIKIDDGKMGPQYNVAQQVLEQLGLLSEEEKLALHPYLINQNRNFAGNVTGETRTTTILKELKSTT
jgi:L-asparaginase II